MKTPKAIAGLTSATIVAAVLTANLGAVFAAPAPGADVRKALQADYSDRDGAVARKDVGGTLAHYAPDFVGVSHTGKAHDIKEERADFVKTFTTLNIRSDVSRSAIQALALGKGGTEAQVTLRRHGVLLIANPQTRLNNVLVLDGVYQDTWAKRSGAWLLTREQEKTIKATMNGLPL